MSNKPSERTRYLPVIAILLCLGATLTGCEGTVLGARGASPSPSAPVTATVATPSVTPSPTSTTAPTRTATAIPSATPSATPSSTPSSTPTPVLTPAPARTTLQGMTWVGQTWNNCAPASLSMVLSFYGVKRGQDEIAKALHPEAAGKHVGPQEMAEYLAGQGLVARPSVNGNVETLQRLVANGIPVIISGWLKADEDIGHYRVVKGYDRAAGTVIVNDAYFGQDTRLVTGTLESLWNPFNHFYMPVYRADREPAVRAILGEDWDQAAMYRRARAGAEAAVQARPNDAYAWFNLGDDNLALDDVPAAVKDYEQAMRLGLPARMLWYRAEPFVAYNHAGQYQRVLDLSAPLLTHITGLAQIYEQRGHAYVGLGKPDLAAAEYRLALQYDPGLTGARAALAKLGGR
ncbi:MAG: C39 family peptidase [Chloroflexota bacterium]|nr:C39 family peptidase [Chloroflexota bacterium]